MLVFLPFLEQGGSHALRFDLPALTLHLAWFRFQMEDFHLVWLAGIDFVFFFLIATVVLGRVWCGWACPQTVLCDLTEGLAAHLGLRRWLDGRDRPPLGRRLTFHLILFLIGLGTGAVVTWYFVPPADYLGRLLSGTLGPWPLGTTVAIGLLVHADLALLRRTVCREFCPYGRFQALLADRGTLTLGVHPDEASRCIQCNACRKACPMGIDIRNGLQIECITCALCLDACRKVMAAQGETGIIRYTFGVDGLGWRALLSPRLLLLSGLLLLLSAGLLLASLTRADAVLKLARAQNTVCRPLAGDLHPVFFSGSLANRANRPRTFTLQARRSSSAPLGTKGATVFHLDGNARQMVHLAVFAPIPPPGQTVPVIFAVLDEEGRSIAEQKALVAEPVIPCPKDLSEEHP